MEQIKVCVDLLVVGKLANKKFWAEAKYDQKITLDFNKGSSVASLEDWVDATMGGLREQKYTLQRSDALRARKDPKAAGSLCQNFNPTTGSGGGEGGPLVVQVAALFQFDPLVSRDKCAHCQFYEDKEARS